MANLRLFLILLLATLLWSCGQKRTENKLNINQPVTDYELSLPFPSNLNLDQVDQSTVKQALQKWQSEKKANYQQMTQAILDLHADTSFHPDLDKNFLANKGFYEFFQKIISRLKENSHLDIDFHTLPRYKSYWHDSLRIWIAQQDDAKKAFYHHEASTSLVDIFNGKGSSYTVAQAFHLTLRMLLSYEEYRRLNLVFVIENKLTYLGFVVPGIDGKKYLYALDGTVFGAGLKTYGNLHDFYHGQKSASKWIVRADDYLSLELIKHYLSDDENLSTLKRMAISQGLSHFNIQVSEAIINDITLSDTASYNLFTQTDENLHQIARFKKKVDAYPTTKDDSGAFKISLGANPYSLSPIRPRQRALPNRLEDNQWPQLASSAFCDTSQSFQAVLLLYFSSLKEDPSTKLHCSDITQEDLFSINYLTISSGILIVNNQPYNHLDLEIKSFQLQDFVGLPNLEVLNLIDISLEGTLDEIWPHQFTKLKSLTLKQVRELKGELNLSLIRLEHLQSLTIQDTNILLKSIEYPRQFILFQ